MCDWTNELSVKFMENYQSQPILWDPKLRGHKDEAKTNDAWTEISKELNILIEKQKNKKKFNNGNISGTFKKKKASIRSGVGQNEVYQPIWFLFNQIDSFLGTINDCNSTTNTEQENNSGINHETEEDENNDSNETTLSNSLNHETLIENQTIRENQTPSKPRRRGTSIELDEAGKQMKLAFSTLKNCIKNKKEEDEYDYYAKILATKIRRLPENEREVFMYEVDGLYINCLRRSNNKSRSTTPEIITSSYPQSDEYSIFNPSSPAVIQNRTTILGTNSRPPTSRSTTSILGTNSQAPPSRSTTPIHGTNSRPPPSRSTTPIYGTNIQSRPPSSLASYSEPEIITSRYPQSDEYSISNPSSPAVIQHRTYSNPLYSEQQSIPIHVTDINQPTMTNSNIISQAFNISHENEEY